MGRGRSLKLVGFNKEVHPISIYFLQVFILPSKPNQVPENVFYFLGWKLTCPVFPFPIRYNSLRTQKIYIHIQIQRKHAFNCFTFS